MPSSRVAAELEWRGCRLCPLCEGRRTVVFGYGDIHANLMFVGEGPGELEDQRGVPFVGKAGEVLDKFLQYFGLGRDEVYVNNVVACRPPGNRDPLADEIVMCLPRLQETIYRVDPIVIVALGKIAFNAITGMKGQIGAARGDFHTAIINRGQWEDEGNDVAYAVIPTYHPSFLTRNMGSKNKPNSPWEQFHDDLELAIELSKEAARLYSGEMEQAQ